MFVVVQGCSTVAYLYRSRCAVMNISRVFNQEDFSA